MRAVNIPAGIKKCPKVSHVIAHFKHSREAPYKILLSNAATIKNKLPEVHALVAVPFFQMTLQSQKRD